MQEAKLHNNIPLKRHLVSKGCSYPLTFQFSVVGKIQDYAELESIISETERINLNPRSLC